MTQKREPFNLSGRFRSALKREIPLWLEAGLIGSGTADDLAGRYRLQELEKESTRLLAGVIFTIAGLLLGGGAIAFVAANWDSIPDPFKLTLLFGTLLGLHGVGFILWRKEKWRRLGHALIFCGCLVFGANIGLVAQIFHISSDWWRGFGVWALGTLAVAWALGSVVIALQALFVSIFWFSGALFDGGDLWVLYPPLVLLLFLPLALRTGSRALHGLTLACFLYALPAIGGEVGESGISVLLAWAASGFAVWSWGWFLGESKRFREQAPAASVLGTVSLAIAAYFWSFHEFWQDTSDHVEGMMWVPFAGIALVAGLILLLEGWRRSRPGGRIDPSRLSILGAAILLIGCGLLSLTVPGLVFLPTVGANIAALLLATGAIGSGLSHARRGRFWAGTIFALLLVLSRFLEYDTSLLVKSLAFTSCGVVVLVAGIQYERFIGRKEAAHV